MVFALSLYIQVVLLLTIGFGLERCRSLEKYIKGAHFYYFGIDFPYHYSIAQAEKESRCRHNVLSSDGIGSEGFAQITHRWWKKDLDKEGIREIKSRKNHARAQAFINYKAYQSSVCKKLFEMYQIYNGGNLVSKEVYPACTWEYGYKRCRRKDVCVNRGEYGCKQYKNACDINYSYSKTIYKLAEKYKVCGDGEYEYW